MNVRPQLATLEHPIALSVSFNQDCSCFSVGCEDGFHVFSTDPCQLHVTRVLKGGIDSATMLGRANFLALVGGGRSPKYAQNKVIIWDDLKQKAVISLEFHSSIRAVRLSRNRIIVVLQAHVHVYAFSTPPTRLHVFETSDNPLGLVAMSTRTLAFPGRTVGHVQLCDLATGNVSIIPAHTSQLAALTIAQNGDVIATASEKGTIMRLWNVQNCALITELRRGIDKAVIYSLAISPDSSRLAVVSDKNTLHIYSLPTRAAAAAAAAGSGGHRPSSPGAATGDNRKWSLLGKLPLLPKYFSSEWSAAQAVFEGAGKAIVGWPSDDSIVVISCGTKHGGAPRWEKFVLIEGLNGGQGGQGGAPGIECVREGWRRYLDNT
ncbi:WD40 repeat-like protein [Ascodesmis nigricans]|uniref:WD40 repeat-like protein n=1 Tax=Ascodesmis nigricans TaxID=341454 RepID=A0A4S2MMQ8_9PEZI|nr:WD40 repeat-like protein [Ascodesmis nigricans]